MTIFDFIGMIGIAVNLFGFFLIQHGTITPVDGRYTSIQCTSCILLMISLWHSFNLSAFTLNVLVIVIALYGFFKMRLKVASNKP